MNVITIMGNMTSDPETREVGQTSVTKFTVANNPHPKADTVFIECECWGDRGARIAEFFGKGRPIAVTGKLNVSNWENSEGQKRSRFFIKVDDWSFVGKKDDAPAPEQTAAF